jgi:hypothetical protein
MRFHPPALDHVVMDWAPVLYMVRVDAHLGAMALSAFTGLTFLFKAGGGLYWLIPATMASLLGGVVNAWLFLVKATS